MMNLQERKQIHKEFMCAALNGIIANNPVAPMLSKTPQENREYVAKTAVQIADAALLAFEERWKGEEE